MEGRRLLEDEVIFGERRLDSRWVHEGTASHRFVQVDDFLFTESRQAEGKVNIGGIKRFRTRICDEVKVISSTRGCATFAGRDKIRRVATGSSVL